MSRLDLQARGFWNGSAVLSKANQVLTSLPSPVKAVFPVICFPHPCRVCPPQFHASPTPAVCLPQFYAPPTPAESVPLNSMLPPPLQRLPPSVPCFSHPCSLSPQSVKKRRQRDRNSPSCFLPCGLSVLYLQAVISPLDYLVTLKAFLCIDNCLNGISTKAWC